MDPTTDYKFNNSMSQVILYCSWFLKNKAWKINFDQLDFLFVSYLIFTVCVAYKKVRNRQRTSLSSWIFQKLRADVKLNDNKIWIFHPFVMTSNMRSVTNLLSTLWPKQACLFTDRLLKVLIPGRLFWGLWSYQISFWLMHHSVEYDLLLTIDKPSGQ